MHSVISIVCPQPVAMRSFFTTSKGVKDVVFVGEEVKLSAEFSTGGFVLLLQKDSNGTTCLSPSKEVPWHEVPLKGGVVQFQYKGTDRLPVGEPRGDSTLLAFLLTEAMKVEYVKKFGITAVQTMGRATKATLGTWLKKNASKCIKIELPYYTV